MNHKPRLFLLGSGRGNQSAVKSGRPTSKFLRIWVLNLFAVFIFGCAPKGTPQETNVICSVEASPVQHLYQNGQTIKSDVTDCSNGCQKFTALDQSGVSETKCE